MCAGRRDRAKRAGSGTDVAGGVEPQRAHPAAGEEFDDALPRRLADGGAALGAGEGVEGRTVAAADREPQRPGGQLEARAAVGAGRP